MRGVVVNRKKIQHGATNSSGRGSCSPVMCCSWGLILVWVLFLVYCWRSGFLVVDKAKLDSLVNNAEGLIEETEEKLMQRLNQLNHLNSGHKAAYGTSSTATTAISKDEVHVVFSTDCSPYQDWQTLVLFHSAKKVGQRGKVTRIASGCDDEKKKQLTSIYRTLYGDEYGAHFTPDFKRDAKTNRKYDFYNKPWGVKHWLEFSDPPVRDNVFVALLDPDMIFLRPITVQIQHLPDKLIDRRIPPDEMIENITLGRPVAQTYGLGAPWANDNHPKFGRGRICGEGSPCLLPTSRYGELHYSVGPPYIAHRIDMHNIAKTWTTFVPRVYEKYPYLLAEMYAYSMAAAHEKLPHLQLENYMVSNVDAGGEGWPHVDALQRVCLPPTADGTFYPGQLLPTVVHFCQTYRAGNLGFMKRRVPHDIFTCESPMLVEPPIDLGEASYVINKDGKKEAIKNARNAKRHAFTVCIAYQMLNSALLDFKQRMCSHPSNHTNYDKTINIATL